MATIQLDGARALLWQIQAGEMDDSLDALEQAIRERRRRRVEFIPGQKVRFRSTGVRPAYLRGQTATVEQVNQTTVNITLDAGTVGKFYGGKIRAHMESLEPME